MIKKKIDNVFIGTGIVLLICAIYLYFLGAIFWFKFLFNIISIIAFFMLWITITRQKKEIESLRKKLKDKDENND